LLLISEFRNNERPDQAHLLRELLKVCIKLNLKIEIALMSLRKDKSNKISLEKELK